MTIYRKMLICVFLILISFTVLAQMSFKNPDGSLFENPDGRPFLKRIEYNSIGFGLPNVRSKTEIEKLFFRDFNAMVEFFILPSFEGAYGFRIFQDSLNNYIIENKHISNWDTVMSQLRKEYPSISIKANELNVMTREEKDKIKYHNREMFDKQTRESFLRYKIVNQSFCVSNLFAEKLYEIVVVTIDNFVGKGEPTVIRDGYEATFRCVVGAEVWTLTVHLPKDEILRLTDICKQLFADVQSKNVDESKYIALFESVTDCNSGKEIDDIK
jgi:hypothetical protein